MSKLYTKEMFLIAAEKCEVSIIDAKHIMQYIDEYVTPIELPTDEVEEKSEKPIILEISNLDIQRKRWEDWEDFNKMAQYSQDSASPYADGFTRGAQWMRDKIKGGNK